MLRGVASLYSAGRSVLLAGVGLCLLAGPLGVSPVRAAEKMGSAIDFIPADASFFSATLRGEELVKIAQGSKAWERFQKIPAVAQAWRQAEIQWNQPDGPMAAVKTAIQLPENEMLIELAGDMFSREVFLYGDERFVHFAETMQAIQGANQLNTLENAKRAANEAANRAAGKDDDDKEDAPSPQVQQGRTMLRALAGVEGPIEIPGFIMGFRITDAAPAKFQLRRLEVVTRGLLGMAGPGMAERLSRVKVDGREYLTMKVEAEQLPWEKIEPQIKGMEETPGEFDELIVKLRAMTLSVTLGVRDDYLLVSFGSNNEHIAKLGKSSSLTTLTELRPLVEARAKTLTSMMYVSKTLAATQAMTGEQLSNLGTYLTSMIPETVEEKLRDEIKADVQQFATELTPYLPEPAAVVSFDFLTETGAEGYQYQYTVGPMIDASKRLDVLSHVGASPLLVIAGRGKVDPKQYDRLVHWVERGNYYANIAAEQNMEGGEKEKFEQVMTQVKPLAARLDTILRESINPALADGQAALVMDAKIESKAWHPQMPASETPLPMLEIGIVHGVSDAKKLDKGLKDLHKLAQDSLEAARGINPDIPADVQVPTPTKRKSADGDQLYVFELPSEAQLDAQIAPCFSFNKRYSILSTSPAMAERVLKESKLEGAPADWSKPAAAVVYLDWAGGIKALTPWSGYTMRAILADAEQRGNPPPFNLEEVEPQVTEVMELLQVLRTVSTVVTVENKTTVVHTRSLWKDVE